MRGNGLRESGHNSSIPTLHMTTQLINIENKNGVAVVSSRVVAKDFGKRHSHVCDTIRNLTAENSEVKNMMIKSTYVHRGNEYDEYLLTRDGFSLLVYGTFENPLFLAKDVAEWIEHSNPSKMLKSVDEDEKVKRILGITNGYGQVGHGGARGNTEHWFLTEDGLYEVLMQSRKPIVNG